MNLDQYNNSLFCRGRSFWVEAMWLLAQPIFMGSWQPSNFLRIWVLRLFGANIGRGVVIKPRVRVKFPWKLCIGEYSWIGEGVWLDNLAEINIGNNCCISQEVYLCTGNHDWASPRFDLIVEPINIHNQVWVCARSVIGPGTTIGVGSILALGAIATGKFSEWSIYSGNPAKKIKSRKITPITNNQ